MKATSYIRRHAILLCLGILCTFVSFKYANPQYTTHTGELHWTVLPNSFITINGRSNINTFGCDASGTFKAEPLHGSLAKDGKSVTMKGAITIAINQFDCHNRMLNADLRKTLKADEYPQMTIRFVSLERMPLCDGGEDFISGGVIIELAGQRKPFNLRYAFSKTNTGYKLEGSRGFSFADFNLTPPKKIGGLVKVKDEFDVAFTLLLDNCK
ncbi:YceI family protein [Parapedobacter koreensis]|uniref:YceI-like domain-containing protein n=1 Tax=Parapedobacter koreensis TaxID=332977 RepID=A0A1H7RJT5_9SPHI|nr:YceI family protein [Parapedobacter koreensis]SEL60550.1 YceI-like domain-containing protein [Parapedobacter koreensis]